MTHEQLGTNPVSNLKRIKCLRAHHLLTIKEEGRCLTRYRCNVCLIEWLIDSGG